jgi:hypothetical protein
VIGVPLEINAGNIDQLATVTDNFTLIDNHITFDIKKNNASSANSGTIVIYNAPRRLAGLIEQTQGQRPIVTFKAGFKDDKVLPELFKGVVELATEVKQGQDFVMTLKLSDGGSNIREFVSKRTYPTGTSIDTILRDLIGDAGLARGPIYELREELRAPLAISGNTVAHIVDITEKFGLNFSVQNQSAYIVPSDAGTDADVVFLSPDTGMVGSPAIGGTPSNLAKDGTTDKRGVKVTSLLNGALIPENFIELKSEKVNGLYKIESVVHTGSYEGDYWYSDITCKPTDYTIQNYVVTVPYRLGRNP